MRGSSRQCRSGVGSGARSPATGAAAGRWCSVALTLPMRPRSTGSECDAMAPRWLGARNSASTPTSGHRTGIEPISTTPIAALRRMPMTKKSRASPEAAAMATAMPTPIRPLMPCWMLSRRTIRSRKTRRATPRAVQMPTCSPPKALATMNATVGSVASIIPRQPPSWSSTRWRSKDSVAPPGSRSSGRSAASSAVATMPPDLSGVPVLPLPPITGGRPSPGAELVPGVVHDLLAVEGGEAPPGGECAARLDAGDAAPAQPHERHRTRAVEQLGLERRHRLPRRVHHRLEAAGHGDDLALAAHAHRLAAGAGRLGAQLLRVDLVVVGGEALQRAGEPPTRLRFGHHSSSLALVGPVPGGAVLMRDLAR